MCGDRNPRGKLQSLDLQAAGQKWLVTPDWRLIREGAALIASSDTPSCNRCIQMAHRNVPGALKRCVRSPN
jgi:hypothetical protein